MVKALLSIFVAEMMMIPKIEKSAIYTPQLARSKGGAWGERTSKTPFSESKPSVIKNKILPARRTKSILLSNNRVAMTTVDKRKRDPSAHGPHARTAFTPTIVVMIRNR